MRRHSSAIYATSPGSVAHGVANRCRTRKPCIQAGARELRESRRRLPEPIANPTLIVELGFGPSLGVAPPGGDDARDSELGRATPAGTPRAVERRGSPDWGPVSQNLRLFSGLFTPLMSRRYTASSFLIREQVECHASGTRLERMTSAWLGVRSAR